NNPIETCTSIYGASRMTKVRDFAYHAVDAGLDGLVCSPHEAEMLKNDPRTAHMLLVIPAIRPPYAINPDEQNIAATPHVAMDAGADLLVIGRPITEAASYGLTGGEAVDLIVENMGMAA
ncbi:MAG TPA: orotidine 5'-phosphate decarboxylase / HUMPS family protein, partial [Patescibacteria group bacterium]|nr:orotidine 5'-phosphate decarboxylase / HUMPS family protein [Patescibacteria group bacterium]